MQRRKKRKPRYGRIVLSILVPIGLIYYVIQSVFSTAHATYTVPVGTLSLEASAPMLIVRNEIVLDTDLTGKITYFYKEGDVVNKGSLVAEVFNDGTEAIHEEANERVLERKRTEFDYNGLAYDIDRIKNEIVFHLDVKNYLPIPSLKKELMLKMDRMERLKDDHRFLANRSLAYAQQTVGEGVLLEGQKKGIHAPASGMISFVSDGLERFVTIENVYNIHFSELRQQELVSTGLMKDHTSPKSQIFRLVDQATYYLAAIIPIDAVETYKQAPFITVEIEGNRLEGLVFDVFTEGEAAVCIIQMKAPFFGFHTRRWVEGKLVREDYRGLKVPTDAIVNRSGVLGVYVLDTNKRLKFTPVKILGYDDEHAIVSNEQFYDSELGLVRSIKLGQEIARHAHLLSEGDRID